MKCLHCGHELASGQEICPSCFHRVQPRGFWARLFGRGKKPPVRTVVKVTEIKRTEFVTEENGQRRVYHSLEEVPPEMRARIEEFQARAAAGQDKQTFTVTDASGKKRTYHSLDEVPPELRAVIEKVWQKGG